MSHTRRRTARISLHAALLTGAVLVVAAVAHASNPLESPDSGSAAFARGGAWLALANEPLATHFNPAALATQASAFSIDQQLSFNKVCYARRGPGNSLTGPDAANTADNGLPGLIYLPACNERRSFPTAVPSLALSFRVSKDLGVGIAIVPPAAYGFADQALPLTARGFNQFTGQSQQIPAPWRYQTANELSLIAFPTVGVGYELFRHFRIGAAFVSGIAAINTQSTGISNISSIDVDSDAVQPDGRRGGDHFRDDSIVTIRAHDLFVPGVILSLHWSVLPKLDVAAWGRWMDAVKATAGYVQADLNTYDANGNVTPTCVSPNNAGCVTTSPNIYPSPGHGNALTRFRYPIPPEARVGMRFHLPRESSRILSGNGGAVRDPLHDDVFDVELDASYSMNSKADHIEVRFIADANGRGLANTVPTGVPLPPNADRPTGYKDSYGVRFGGQWNAVQDKLALRAGGWFETQSQDPAYLTVNPVGDERYGFGGGVVFRQNFVDVSFGYQRHLSAGLDNGGNGKLLTPVGTGGTPDNRSFHAVNGGKVTQSAHVLTLGGTIRF